MKGEGPTTLQSVGRGEDWATWISYPAEGMERASHVLASAPFEEDPDCWLVDPVDAENLDDWLDDLGDVAGVVVLFNRHARDADAIAERHDVAVHVPAQLAGIAEDVDAPVEPFEGTLGNTGFRELPIVQRRVWRESGLYDPDRATLVVPEAVGTALYFRTRGECLGVHPLVRFRPPRDALGDVEPDRVLCGHGEPVVDDATDALQAALRDARRGLPALYATNLRRALPV